VFREGGNSAWGLAPLNFGVGCGEGDRTRMGPVCETELVFGEAKQQLSETALPIATDGPSLLVFPWNKVVYLPVFPLWPAGATQ
jgi:hypothetical protein